MCVYLEGLDYRNPKRVRFSFLINLLDRKFHMDSPLSLILTLV